MLYIGAPVLAVLAVTFTGYKMIKSGYADKYQRYSMNVNQDWKNLMDNFEKIQKHIIKETDSEVVTGEENS